MAEPQAQPAQPQHSPFPAPDSSTRWSSYLLYETTYFISMLGMLLGYSLRTEGVRHVPRRGPVLFIANHQSFLDPVLVGLAVRRHLSYLARQTLFGNPAFAWLIRMLNAVPIDQEGVGIQGLRTTVQLLKGGRAVVIFPEGERTEDGAVHPLQPGIQLLIKRSRAPVVPVGIAGAFEAWPRSRHYPIPAPLFLPAQKGTLAVSIGQALDTRRLAGLPRPKLLDELFIELQEMRRRAEQLRRKSALSVEHNCQKG